MTKQDFILRDWDWSVTAFYEAGPDDAEEIISVLREAGCSGTNLRRASSVVRRKADNCGVTFSSYDKHRSVMVIGRTSSADEFQNSYDHEKGHLCKHICQALGIDPFGEESEYLAGAIGKHTFKVARSYLCEHCRKLGKD